MEAILAFNMIFLTIGMVVILIIEWIKDAKSE